MFVDLMNDIYNTFSDRFLKVQLQFGPPPPIGGGERDGDGRGRGGAARPPQKQRRYNALGVLEDVPDDESAAAETPEESVLDIGPDQPPKPTVAARKDPVVIGAGRTRSLGQSAAPADIDWTTVGRNDPCPCGSGKKFKKCHGATL